MKTYYQPELTDEFLEAFPDFHSFFVFRSKKLAEAVFPDSKILTYTGNDIENPTYVDKDYTLHLIDVRPLEEKLEREFGFKLKIYKKVLKTTFGNKQKLELSTTNLVSQAGVFRNFLKEVEVSNRGGGVPDSEGLITFYMRIYYKTISGGTNGIFMGTVYYDMKTKNWTFHFKNDKMPLE